MDNCCPKDNKSSLGEDFAQRKTHLPSCTDHFRTEHEKGQRPIGDAGLKAKQGSIYPLSGLDQIQ
jgi:hypothetical protein